MMMSYFLEGSTTPWQTATYEGHVALDFHARYFTLRKDTPNERHLPFVDRVDPDGFLESLRRHDLIHGPDNQVMYLKLLENNEYVVFKSIQLRLRPTHARYGRLQPEAFKVGDVVEVSIVFVALPVKDNKRVVIPQLRAMTLLNGDIRWVTTAMFYSSSD